MRSDFSQYILLLTVKESKAIIILKLNSEKERIKHKTILKYGQTKVWETMSTTLIYCSWR